MMDVAVKVGIGVLVGAAVVGAGVYLMQEHKKPSKKQQLKAMRKVAKDHAKIGEELHKRIMKLEQKLAAKGKLEIATAHAVS